MKSAGQYDGEFRKLCLASGTSGACEMMERITRCEGRIDGAKQKKRSASTAASGDRSPVFAVSTTKTWRSPVSRKLSARRHARIGPSHGN